MFVRHINFKGRTELWGVVTEQGRLGWVTISEFGVQEFGPEGDGPLRATSQVWRIKARRFRELDRLGFWEKKCGWHLWNEVPLEEVPLEVLDLWQTQNQH